MTEKTGATVSVKTGKELTQTRGKRKAVHLNFLSLLCMILLRTGQKKFSEDVKIG